MYAVLVFCHCADSKRVVAVIVQFTKLVLPLLPFTNDVNSDVFGLPYAVFSCDITEGQINFYFAPHYIRCSARVKIA